MDDPPAPRRSAAKRQAILAAAAALVDEEGYAPVTMEAVAARAGVGKQTLYRHWASKPALFLEAYANLVPREALTPDASLPGLSAVRAVLQELFASYATTPAAAILAGLIGAAPGDAAARTALKAGLVLGRQDLLTAPLQRAMAEGALPPGFDAALAARTMTALIWQAVVLNPASLTASELETILRAGLAVGREEPHAG